MAPEYQEKPIRKIFYKALRFMLVADIVQSLQEVLLDYYISKHLGSDGLAAFGISYPLITVIMALMAWVVAGIQAVCARDVSTGDQRSARIHLCSGLTWGFLIMSAFALVCWAFHYPLITVLGAADEYAHLRSQSTEALLTGSLAGPFFCILMILLTNLIFNQKRKNALILGIISIAVQIITTSVVSDSFPTMAGIWSGYLLGLIISDFVILLYLRISTKNTESMFYDIRPMTRFEGVRDSLKTGFPELLCWIYSVITFALRNNLVLRVGSRDALAAITLRDGVEYGELLQTVVFYAVLVTIGTAYGSRDAGKYHAYVSTVAKSIIRIAISGGIVLMLTAWPILKFFVNESDGSEVFTIALKLMFIYGLHFIFYLMNNAFSSLYETVGLLKYAHLNYLMEVLLYSVLMLFLGNTVGINGIWFAQPVSEVLLLLFNLALAWKNCGHFPRSFLDLSFDKALRGKM